MPVALRCPCGNLSFSLAAAPQPVPTPPTFSSSIKRFGRAELTVAGANWVWEVLVESKNVSPEWRVTSCLNCRTDCYAQRIGTQELLVNAELRPREEVPGAEGGLHWSAALGVAVESNPDVSNSLLEAPEVMDDRAVEVFQALQRVVESHVSVHTAAVHERIRAFEEEQREALSAYTINAYRDRKVLWHNICAALAKRHAPLSVSNPSSSTLPAPSHSTVPSTAPLTASTSAAAPSVPALPVVADHTSPGPASAALSEWLRASSSAALLPAAIIDSDSPRVARANAPATSPTTSAAPIAVPAPTPAPAAQAQVPTQVAASLPVSAISTSPSRSAGPLVAPAPFPTAAPTATAIRQPSPRPRTGLMLGVRGPQTQIQLASSAPASRTVLSENDVFRLEEEESAAAAEAVKAQQQNEEDDEAEDKATDATGTAAALPPLRARAAYRELPAVMVAPSADAIFGTSVPISIPPPRSSASSAAAPPAPEEPSFDVPLSSTRRMKGYL